MITDSSSQQIAVGKTSLIFVQLNEMIFLLYSLKLIILTIINKVGNRDCKW